jgi:type IV pilus assembly protein PilQ
MKKYLSGIFIVSVIIASIFTYITGSSFAAVGDGKSFQSNQEAVASGSGLLENILLAKLPGKERILLVVSRQPVVNVQSRINGNYLIKLEDMLVPDSLYRSLGEGELNNIISIVPKRHIENGKNWVYLQIAAGTVVPYSIRQEGQNILIDFNVSSLQEKKPVASPGPAAQKEAVAKVSAGKKESFETAKKFEEQPVFPVREQMPASSTDRIISLDFQEADIKSVLRLMAEYGNVSIVSSDDVKGTITLAMKNVPWSKALETILDVNSLAKREKGNVIIVTTQERRKKDDDASIKATEDEKKREEQDRLERAEKGLLKQVMIEAKIVEATEEFVRNIGVQWGFGNQQKYDSGQYGLGLSGGSSTSSAKTYTQSYPSQIGIKTPTGTSLAMAAVNFPSTVSSPAIGLVFGGLSGFLETQLAALETNSMGKIISAPKIVTMEGIKAVIKQGEEVPYTTPASGTSPATVSFKEALLKLEVTPKLTPDGRISMDITASNDYPDWSKAAQNPENNPPIVKNEVQSKVVINDGDTVVVGGIVKSTDSKGVSGWPWLQKIPVLGWLFKTENTSRDKRQLLIFVTPKILQSDYVGDGTYTITSP